MKTGVCSYCFNSMLTEGKLSLMEAIEFVGKETEADCFEPYSPYWSPDRDVQEQAREARKLMDRVGLQASCHALATDFAVYDEGENRACLDWCEKMLQVAVILGANTVRVDPRTASPPGRSRDDIDPEDALARVAQSMQTVADIAIEKGLKVGVENHGLLLGRTSQTARIVERVNRPNFGVNLDFTNFRTVFGEDHVEATRLLARHVVHIHAKDFHIRQDPQPGEEWREIPSGEYVKRAIGGEGNSGWAEIFRILKDVGYKGTISLEVSDPADIRGSVAKGAANLKRIISEVEQL